MDVAYDHIQEEILASNDSRSTDPTEAGNASAGSENGGNNQNSNVDLSAEFQETFRAFQASPWGARLGGLWGNVRRQGESYYEGARHEYSAASEEAAKGLSGLRDSLLEKTKDLSLNTLTAEGEHDKAEAKEGDAITPTAEAAQDGEGFISRFRAEAAKRLKDIEKAEDAADEALLRFGSNVRNFLRDAVSIAPPDEKDGKVLFESKDVDGKRVIHTTRFDAQLHAIHSNLESFSKDPVTDEWPKWTEGFQVDSKTDDISMDLEKYPELRRAMESLVPEKVDYPDFWRRYYFLRMVIETEEKRRKELLKGASAQDDEEVAWDEDSDEESPSTPQVKSNKQESSSLTIPLSSSSKTLSGIDPAKPGESRQSNDQQSQADSDASYDLVSGTTSRTPSSPKDEKTAANPQADDSDEDWE